MITFTTSSDPAFRDARQSVWDAYSLGKEYTALYNDGYIPILGTRLHPDALGSLPRNFCGNMAQDRPMFDDVVLRGKSVGLPSGMYALRAGELRALFVKR